MEHLTEITRIIDGAMKGDRSKVIAYVEQMARKLRETGDISAAERIQRTVDQVKVSEVTSARLDGPPRLPVDSESRLSLADEERIDASRVPVILTPTAQQIVDEFVQFVKAADRLLASRVGVSPSMIIYGPPGVGKTELARHIAGRLGLPLITSRSDTLISSFLGSTAKNLRVLFDHAKSRPCVLFLDELDALAKLRDDQNELGELKRVVVSLLQNIDALDNEVVLLGATNHHHLLDPAVWRRFAYRLEMNLPTQHVRNRLFELFLRDFQPEEDLNVFAETAEGLSGADIRQLCENAIRTAVLADSTKVNPTDVLRGIVRARFHGAVEFAETSSVHVKAVRDLSPKFFTCKRLALLFQTSEPTISRRLNDSEVANARKRTKTADQSSDPPGTGPKPAAPGRRGS